jgi:mannose-6-phosphate isomerase
VIGPLRTVPDPRPRVWGGSRLAGIPGVPAALATARPGPIGEAWLVGEGSVVAAGPCAGRTVADIAAEHGEALLGCDGIAQAGGRFPLLAKLLDAHDWLSIQVHPDDATALRLDGPGQLGKTEGWYVLEADPDARLIVGVRPGADPARVRAGVLDGSLPDLLATSAVRPGDVLLIRAGTLHSIGPGVLLYEIQQSSDLTYRVSDWGRPESAGRPLHLEKSLAALDPAAVAVPRATALGPDDLLTAISCEKFVADLVAVRDGEARLDTHGRSFHAITVVHGSVAVAGAGWAEPLATYESLIVPAEAGGYEIRPAGGPARAVVARVP